MSATTKKPSLYARKLLEKLRTLNSNASLESRQTIANWMVFNRKKAEGMGEGLLLAITDGVAAPPLSAEGSGGGGSSLRLLLLLRVLHQVFLEGKDDSDAYEKSSQLRSILADVALIPLLKALANSISSTTGEQSENYQNEVREMIESWKEYNVFDGPTVWEGYKKAWGRALADTKEKKNTSVSGEIAAGETDKASADDIELAFEPIAVVLGGPQSTEEGAQQTLRTKTSSSSTKEIDVESNNTSSQIIIDSNKDDTKEEHSAKSNVATEPIASTTTEEEEVLAVDYNKEPDRRFSKRDSLASVASVDIDFDAEGVEEAEVEPAKFLEASKVIASLQIARDLGSDAAMNLSSALDKVPAEVEQACEIIYAQQQQEGGEDGTTSMEELISTEQLSNLPDEILDIDFGYARKSLHTYREAILQQRKARLQCLHLLLQSRCSFGSLDAARAFGCDDGSNEGMDIILVQLKKMKEKLIDAMALEGLDVEEDDVDEKKMKEEEQLKPLSWFPGRTKESEEPASKKQKVA